MAWYNRENPGVQKVLKEPKVLTQSYLPVSAAEQV